MGFRGPIKMTLRNQHVKTEDLFFFWDHIKFRTKLRHFLRVFWSSQNRKSVIFEQAPGPRSALGAPDHLKSKSNFSCWLTVFSLIAFLYFPKLIPNCRKLNLGFQFFVWSSDSTPCSSFIIECPNRSTKKEIAEWIMTESIGNIYKSWLVEQNLRIALIKMFMSSKQLFVWLLSRTMGRMESAGKQAATYRKKPSSDCLEKDQ